MKLFNKKRTTDQFNEKICRMDFQIKLCEYKKALLTMSKNSYK